MKERILGIANLFVTTAIVLSYFYAKGFWLKVFVIGEIFIILLCIFCYDTDADYGCLVLFLGYTVLFPAYIAVHSFIACKDGFGLKERIIGGLGLVASVIVFSVAIYSAFF